MKSQINPFPLTTFIIDAFIHRLSVPELRKRWQAKAYQGVSGDVMAKYLETRT